MTYADYIAGLKSKFRDRKVVYENETWHVVDVDYNGMLLLDKPARFTDTTAIDPCNVRLV